MKRSFFIIVTILSLLLVMAFHVTDNQTTDYWRLTYNDSTLVEGSKLRMDTILRFHSKDFRVNDSLKFYYFPCNKSYNKYITYVFLTYDNKRKLVSHESVYRTYEYGQFSVNRLKEISDSCNCEFLELQWLMRDVEFRSIVKLKVVD